MRIPQGPARPTPPFFPPFFYYYTGRLHLAYYLLTSNGTPDYQLLPPLLPLHGWLYTGPAKLDLDGWLDSTDMYRKLFGLEETDRTERTVERIEQVGLAIVDMERP